MLIRTDVGRYTFHIEVCKSVHTAAREWQYTKYPKSYMILKNFSGKYDIKEEVFCRINLLMFLKIDFHRYEYTIK